MAKSTRKTAAKKAVAPKTTTRRAPARPKNDDPAAADEKGVLKVGIIKEGRQIGRTIDEVREDHRKRYDYAVERLKEVLPANTLVLDLGCGTGYGSKMLAEAGFKVLAIDVDGDILKYGEEHYPHPDLVREVHDLTKGIPKEIMDHKPLAATAFEFLEHVANGPDIMRQLAREGVKYLIGSVPNELVVPYDPKKHDRHVRHYTPHEIKNKLVRTGWSPVYIGGQAGKTGAVAAILDQDPNKARTVVFLAVRSE